MEHQHYLQRELYELIRTDESAFELLQNAALDGLWYWDFERPEHEWISPRFWKLLGYDPAAKKHLASEWQCLIHSDDLEVVLDNVERHCADASHAFDQVVRFRHSDGSTIWVRCRGVAIRGPDGNARRLLATHTDISTAKRMEDELRRTNGSIGEPDSDSMQTHRQLEQRTRELERAEAKYKDLFDNSPDMLGVVDANSANLVACNRKLASTLGYERSELIGRPVFDLYHPSCLDAAKSTFRSFKRTGVVRDVELQMMRKDGRIVDVVLNGTDIRDEQGNLLHRRSAWHDISERKRIESQIARRNEDLETLLNVVSHDLREPLRAIRTFSKMVEERYASHLDAKGQDFLGRVARAAQRLDVMIDETLELSRARRAHLATRVTEGRIIVDRALAQLEPAIADTGARLSVEADLPWVRADPAWAVRAVSNLISNALKFRVPDSPPDLEIGTYRPEPGDPAGVGIVVRDRGPGVSPEHAERIFQLFQRGVGREIQGTGAGLAIVRQVASRHGGRAWVRPRRGGGSEFIVTFGHPPIEDEQTTEQGSVLHTEN